MEAIRGIPIGTLNELMDMTAAASREMHMHEFYWFKCPVCQFDWLSWLRPSILFVSLLFVTEQCPNCRKKHIRAHRIAAKQLLPTDRVQSDAEVVGVLK
jgi:hypothetical protein